MRVLFVLVAIVAISAVRSQNTVNHLDTCLTNIKVTTHAAMTGLEDGLQRSWLDMAKWLMTTGADAVQNFEDCRQVNIEDGDQWLMANTSPATQACISLALGVGIDVAAAKSSGKMSDWVHVISDLDKMSQQCMLE